MSPRQLANVVYAHLVTGGDAEGREKFDQELNAPAAGWSTTQARVWELVEEVG